MQKKKKEGERKFKLNNWEIISFTEDSSEECRRYPCHLFVYLSEDATPLPFYLLDDSGYTNFRGVLWTRGHW